MLHNGSSRVFDEAPLGLISVRLVYWSLHQMTVPRVSNTAQVKERGVPQTVRTTFFGVLSQINWIAVDAHSRLCSTIQRIVQDRVTVAPP